MAAAGGIPLLTGLLLAYYAVYVLRSGARLVPVAAVATGGGPPPSGWGRARSWRWPAG